MKATKPKNLEDELRLAGASNQEAIELAALASGLKQLQKDPTHTTQKRRWNILIPIGLSSAAGLVVGMVLIILSQTVLPGNVLYPVQAASDHVAVALNSGYRGTLMMKRAQQVKQLIATDANSKLVMATLADYQTEAAAYKSVPANYAVYEYCKSNLQQAANLASSSEKQAINHTLESLENV